MSDKSASKSEHCTDNASSRLGMKKKDFMLLGAIVAFVLVAFFVISLTKSDGETLIVRIDGKQTAKYSLLEDGEYSLNGGTNILRIEQGKAFLISATCPDQLCVHQGKIDRSGETITCLPNRLTLTVYGNKDSGVDLIN